MIPSEIQIKFDMINYILKFIKENTADRWKLEILYIYRLIDWLIDWF